MDLFVNIITSFITSSLHLLVAWGTKLFVADELSEQNSLNLH